MRKCFLTLDLEEWYHLEYARPYATAIDSQQRFVPGVIPFLERMAQEGIYMTVFVLGSIADQNPGLVKQICEMGHEIGCHGLNHDLVYHMSDRKFRDETTRARDMISDAVGCAILGYRAPCYSMTNSKLDLLWDMGFVYDSSFIRFKQHELYSVLDMSSFEKVESLIYRKGGHYEFEIPTVNILGVSVPISGGGYFRLFPLWLTKALMRKHWLLESNFVLYVHPFEISGSVKLKHAGRLGLANYLRFQIGRRTFLEKLYSYLRFLRSCQVRFMRFADYVNEG
jgi:polysaccharide deacetylase family protein (PEP-CTERM system associated)